MNTKALLIGINYVHSTKGRLRGCVQDARNVRSFLIENMKISEENIKMYSDEDDKTRKFTTAQGILTALYDMVTSSWIDDLDMIWIHYSGHGSHVFDSSGDERDKRDECIVPSDYETSGVIIDDTIHAVFSKFNPKTRIFCVFDCCHSGTIADLMYRYLPNSPTPLVERKEPISSKIISISGCLDEQVSMDAYNVTGDNTFSGALTSCMLEVFQKTGLEEMRNDPLKFIQCVRASLQQKRFHQYPQICSSFELKNETLW